MHRFAFATVVREKCGSARSAAFDTIHQKRLRREIGEMCSGGTVRVPCTPYQASHSLSSPLGCAHRRRVYRLIHSRGSFSSRATLPTDRPSERVSSPRNTSIARSIRQTLRPGVPKACERVCNRELLSAREKVRAPLASHSLAHTYNNLLNANKAKKRRVKK